MAVDLWNRENEAQEDNDIWRWGDQRTIAFVMFSLNSEENHWCAARRAFFDTYEDYELDENHKAFDGSWVHNFYYYVASGNSANVKHTTDTSEMEITLADQFFSAVKAGDVVCAPNTKVYIILHSQLSEIGGAEIFEGTWGAMDDFAAFAEGVSTEKFSAEGFSSAAKLAEYLLAQIKSLRPLMQGELTEEDYTHMKREEEKWLAVMK